MAVKVGSGASNVTIQVKFFASLRESVGLNVLDLDVDCTTALRHGLSIHLQPIALEALYADGVQLAINQELIGDDWRKADFSIPAGAEVAFLPRITGG